MADLKESIADGLKVRRAASAATDVMRKAEHDADIAVRPTSDTVTDAIAAVTHDAVTVQNSNSLNLTLNGQDIIGSVRPAAATVIQSAGGPTTESFGAIADGDTIVLAKQNVTVTAVERYDVSNVLQSTGVLSTDYDVDAEVGTVYIYDGSNLSLVTAGDYVKVSYSYGEVGDGPALTIDADGVRVNLGTAHHQASRGDHRHTNDHRAATGGTTSTVTITVSPTQKITADWIPDPAGDLVVGSSGPDVRENTFAPYSHTHSTATSGAAGFMSAADKVKLDAIVADNTFPDTTTISWTIGGGENQASVKLGVGLTTDGSGVAVDFADVSSADHVHETVTGSNDGLMTSALFDKVEAATFVYRGYADAVTPPIGSSGVASGFSLTFDADKQWEAIRISDTPISSPDAATFSGLWQLRMGHQEATVGSSNGTLAATTALANQLRAALIALNLIEAT